MTTKTAPLLIEIGCEELPPKALNQLSQAFSSGLAQALSNAMFSDQEAAMDVYASPRRLAVLIHHVRAVQPDRNEQRRGPAVQAAFDEDGKPTKAALGFARSVGVEDPAELSRLSTDKGEWLAYELKIPGQPLSLLFADMLTEVLSKLPVPKPMRWGSSDVLFVRPVHWIVALHGDDVVEGHAMEQSFGRVTYGHRFHAPESISLDHASDYQKALENAYVLVDPTARRARIVEQVETLAAAEKATPVLAEEVLAEVVNLVEWPVSVLGKFDARFLKVPAQALISSMEQHQRFFPLRDGEGALLPLFIGVANVESKEPDQIRSGYEKVITPRLADAEFFFTQDQKQTLEQRFEKLKSIVYQKKLGSIADKTLRVMKLAEWLAPYFDGIDRASLETAARLSRCDLVTQMVMEFPELQGQMGYEYASAEGLDSRIATALKSFYQPANAGAAIAEDNIGRCLGIADRVDTLAGIFAVGQKPSGNKDPFALRRAAMGVAKISMESGIGFPIRKMLATAVSNLPEALQNASLIDDIWQFILDRVKAGYAGDTQTFLAVAAVANDDLVDFEKRLRACESFKSLPEADSLASANKRIQNILRKVDSVPDKFDVDLCTKQEEKKLASILAEVESTVQPLVEKQTYELALKEIARLRDAVDAFFEAVMVMDKNIQTRNNRLALLQNMRRLFRSVADIAQLAA